MQAVQTTSNADAEIGRKRDEPVSGSRISKPSLSYGSLLDVANVALTSFHSRFVSLRSAMWLDGSVLAREAAASRLPSA